MTGKFGPRIHPITKKAGHHNGIDYGGKRGKDILCPADGTVTSSRLDPKGYGNYVGVTNKSGHVLVFAHLDSRAVKKGDKVRRGDSIGQLGSTGASTGPHLHFQINRPGGGVRGSSYWGDPDKFDFEEEDKVDIILLNSQSDAQAGFWLHQKTGATIVIRGAGNKLLPLARTIYIVGGEADSVHRLAPQATLVHLAGRDQQGTMRMVLDFLDGNGA